MNKQELIETLAKRISTLEDFRGISGFHDGNYAGLEYALNLIQQLDEQQKLILPKCAEQWIEGHCAPSDVVNLFIEVTCATDSDGFIDSKWRWSTDFYEWLANDADTLYILCDALRYGYEVEKEPLWAIKNADGNYLTKCALWGKDGVNYSFECNPSHRLLFTDKATADAAALLVNGTVEEGAEG
ncbi:DUF1642 domain-containing protein [Enterococcus faecium]|uniref:DUF1642 domain-containing protein n=1 Tax=Enterococcus TaxID=1350 RepID=UPI00032E91EA|nr:DUF1642 domain-containing protein [Enterococcus faecium]EME3598961.1 DUF1642 domain-containing protein [Enterococcus faecium]EME8178187.1 DUF1642 domain-containing protein [Enterococcus faecium]EMF0413038.1 DUF1642 domain-containing protein [Enterococcus faecium]EMF0585932.1 DUF1642 domain-containing protein [Enterococcus faecium]EOH47132.1 hypothetical protein SSI_00873 [Enterococcus faecium EnGen0191]